MFLRPIQTAEQRLHVKAIVADRGLAGRIKTALDSARRFHVELLQGPLSAAEPSMSPAGSPSSLVIVELSEKGGTSELAVLEGLLKSKRAPSRIIVISNSLPEMSARRLLKLQVSDWLPSTCSDQELIVACEQAINIASVKDTAALARCTTFMSAIGGAGATTLSLAAASVLSARTTRDLSATCVVDLNFQNGSLADYLDLKPNLQLAEIAESPQRLDGHLLEVMLTRHASGLSILAAPASLRGPEATNTELVGKVLDLASLKFEHLIIDVPCLWRPWCENIVRGTDALFIVTEMTVTGLRQAHRLAEMVADTCAVNTKGTVIVNKVPWLGGGGVKKKHAQEVLGELLAGFVSECRTLVRDAQNHGAMLSRIKRRNRIEADLSRILLAKDANGRAADQKQKDQPRS